MNDHTYTDKTLQGNNKIESAIAALQQEPSQEMLAHVLTVIRRRMNEHGELIIAVDLFRCLRPPDTGNPDR